MRLSRINLTCLQVVSLLVVYAVQLSADTRIILGANASAVEKVAAEDLREDILKVYPEEIVTLDTFPLGGDDKYIGNTLSLGTLASLSFIKSEDALEPETYLLESQETGPTMEGSHVVILGADDRGVMYGVYEFSKRVLGIDGMEYWTGKLPSQKTSFEIPELSVRERPPAFKLRGYLDNDNDMLANWKGRKLIVEFDIWKEMIDSLARLRYNYIDIHDLLGRPEYYLRDYYINMTDYHTDLELVDQVIDYAHSKGMLVQIPMYLGWEFMHLEMDEVCLTSNFDRWMDLYRYYLSETPLGKGDLFLARPRHPIYDWPYSCPDEEALGIQAGPLMEVVFSGLGKLINKYSPGGMLICDLWQEGRVMWGNGQFSPRREVQLLWADDGFAKFEEWPSRLRAYTFGIYVHAGVWKNQVVQDPYPQRIKEAVDEAVVRGMTANILVNGQSFKPFILNLEACARAAWAPELFDADAFYLEWTSRYFGEAASSLSVESLKLLHQAHDYSIGFREVTKASEKILKNLNQGTFEMQEITDVRTSLALARKSLELAQEAELLVPQSALDVFDDQVLFPCQLYVENLELLKSLIDFNNACVANRGNRSSKAKAFVRTSGLFAREQLLNLRASLERGSRWEKWKNWTHPDHFRIQTPPPKLEDIDSIIRAL